MSSIIVDAKSALDRLSKVNRKLLFLAKLENNFYVNKTEIDLCQLIKDKVHLMEDLYHQKNISLSLLLDNKLNVQADMYLMESLVMNLLSNILKYTPRNGRASVRILENKILFSNEGNELPFSPERIFERFKKGTDDQRSNGLGLSIVKQICEINGWVVSYNYHIDKHVISIYL
jgi:signal transduction histidine kinase